MLDVDTQTPPSPSERPALLPFRDEEGDLNAGFVASVAEAIQIGDAERLRGLTADLHEADLGDLLEALAPDLRPRLIELLGRDFDFTVLTEVDEAVREEILEELETATVVEGVRELESDDAVTILEALDEEDQAEVLEQLPAVERVTLQRSLDYPEGTAGRRMQTEFIAVPPFWTVGQTIDFMRETEDLPDTFYEIFVIDPGGHLLGSVALDKLLRSKRPVRVSDIMTDDPDQVEATDPLDEVARRFERYNWVSAAVVDEAGRLVGAVGRVLPATIEPVHLVAESETGAVSGEVAVSEAGRIAAVGLVPADAPAPKEAVEAIERADQVVLGPGSLFTSVLAASLVADVRRALAGTAATKVYVCNLDVVERETQGFDVAAHVDALGAHGVHPDVVLADEAALPMGRPAVPVVTATLRTDDQPGHDEGQLAKALRDLLGWRA